MENENDSIFGERFLQIRQELDWTQKVVAKRSGLRPEIVMRAEQGLGSVFNIMKLADFYYSLGYNYNWMFARENSHIPKKVEKKPTDQELNPIMKQLDEFARFDK